MYGTQKTPSRTIEDGSRVVTTRDVAYLGGWNSNSRYAGATGVVVGYATPEIQERQIWPTESYYVSLDGEDGIRVLDREALEVRS